MVHESGHLSGWRPHWFVATVGPRPTQWPSGWSQRHLIVMSQEQNQAISRTNQAQFHVLHKPQTKNNWFLWGKESSWPFKMTMQLICKVI